ncbi:hypothetical protein N0V90_011401 [Kalmusia sp. IMI 367209]|nr:hypothetical protein N0V90_011401 [Kalmusia sp. IMI 367209]
MANVSFGTAYANDIILAQKIFYKQDLGIVFQLLLTITTSSVGYGIAGIMRRFLVHPAAMIWPINLVSVTLLHAMHEKEEDLDPTKYKEAPEWWYGALFLLMFVLSLVTVLAYPTEFTWWAFLIAIAFSTLMALPIGIIQAIKNLQIGLNVITEFIMGYMQPGKLLALMMLKTYGYITASSALGFVGDLKY